MAHTTEGVRKLPSGELRVDSYSTLDQKAAPVPEFPKGDDELTLLRVAPFRSENVTSSG